MGDTFLAFAETAESKIFPNEAFGYRKIVVERPLRPVSQLTPVAAEALRFASGDEAVRAELVGRFGPGLFTAFEAHRADVLAALLAWTPAEPTLLPEKRRKKLLDAKTWQRDHKLAEAVTALRDAFGGDEFRDHDQFRTRVEAATDRLGLRLTATDLKALYKACSRRDPDAPPVLAKVYASSKAVPAPLRGPFAATVDGRTALVRYEPDPDLRDTEQVPLGDDVQAFLRREVLPYTPDAWWDEPATKIGYEISFTRHFYRPAPLRSLDAIRADILALEDETHGLLGEIGGDR